MGKVKSGWKVDSSRADVIAYNVSLRSALSLRPGRVCRQGTERIKEGPAINAMFIECLHQCLFIETIALVEDHCIHPVAIPGARRFRIKCDAGHASQFSSIPGKYLALPCNQFLYPLQLRQTKRSLHTAHLVFVSNLGVEEHPIAGRAAVIPKK